MKISVIVPYRPGCPDRAAAWCFLATLWERGYPSWQRVVSIDDQDGPWRKGLAVARGLQTAKGEIIIVADADVWCPTIDEAVQAIERSAAWVRPFRAIFRLNPAATAAIYSGESFDAISADRKSWAERPYVHTAAGGMVVVRRDLLEAVPIDPRFIGWGGEDYAWGYALRSLAGNPAQLAGKLFHLWHPPQNRLSRSIGSIANQTLKWRYAKARREPSAMASLIDEAHAALRSAYA